MTFNTIMVQLDVDSPAAPRTTYALELARRFEATLIGFAAADSYVFVPGDDGGMAAAEIMRQRRTEIEDRLKVLKKEFLSVVVGHDASWREAFGEHRAIRDAIASSSGDKAREAMRWHLKQSQERFSQSFGDGRAANGPESVDAGPAGQN